MNGLRILRIATLSFLLIACGPEKEYPRGTNDTSCNAGVAQIAIYDGLVENLCGCQEPRAPGTFTTCTVAAGTSVVFYFPINQLKHQIISTGAQGFPASTIYDPDSDVRSYVHAVILVTPGIYRFADAYHPSLGGQIIVF